MSTVKIPDIKGVTEMTPLELNEVSFDKKHTVLTPEVLQGFNSHSATSISDNRNTLNGRKP